VRHAHRDSSTGSVRQVAEPFCRGFWKFSDGTVTGQFSVKLWPLTIMMGDEFVDGKNTDLGIPVIFPTMEPLKKFNGGVLYSQCNAKVPSIACVHVFQPNVTVNLVLTEIYTNRIYYRLFSSLNNDSYSLWRH
jgi:hypothetical protein